MTSAPLGIVPVVGIPGGGKTHLLATVAMVCLGSTNFNKLMCCTPTHAAADALTGKLDVVSRKAIAAFNSKVPVQQQKRQPIIIRAYHDRAEIDRFSTWRETMGNYLNAIQIQIRGTQCIGPWTTPSLNIF